MTWLRSVFLILIVANNPGLKTFVIHDKEFQKIHFYYLWNVSIFTKLIVKELLYIKR